MKTADSRELLAAYARDGSETAFRELVERYINLVYSTALRLAGGDSHFAEDVAQTVFINLARKAGGLSSRVLLGGWLHRCTCHVAATMLRAERRRQQRERQAMQMNSQPDHTPGNLARVAPILDEAINQLNAKDRAAIILRFFEQRDFRSVGQELNSSENAARVRVDRALNKLHAHLSRRGVVLGAGALAPGLAAEATMAAPAGLAAAVAGTVLSQATLGGGLPSVLVKVLTMTKLKAAVLGTMAILTLAALLAARQRAQGGLALTRLRQENEALRSQLSQAQELTRRQARLAAEASELERLRQAQSDLPRLREELKQLRRQAASAQSTQSVEAVVENTAPTNVISGFTRLQANAHSLVPSGQRLLMGGWPGHPGLRVFLSVVPEAGGEKGDQVSLRFQAIEIPEQFLAGTGLEGIRAEGASSELSTILSADQAKAVQNTLGTSSALSIVLSADQAKALQETLGKIMGVVQQAANQPDDPGKYMHCFGGGYSAPFYWHSSGTFFDVTNGQTAGINCMMVSYENGGYTVGNSYQSGDKMMIVPDKSKGLDLGPYSGLPLTVTPVIQADGKTIDLTVQATLFWHFGDSP